MVLGEPKLFVKRPETFAHARDMICPTFDLFQNHVLLTKYVNLVYEMLILILNEQPFLIQFLDIHDVSKNVKLPYKHNITLCAHWGYLRDGAGNAI